MSIYLYEKSIVNTMTEITGDSRVRVVSPDESITYLAQLDKDKVVFPAILLSRNTVRLQEYKNQVVALKGQTANVDDEGFIVKAQLIPVHVEWSVDVYATDRLTCDEIIRELIFYFITHPRFEVDVPYQLKIPQNFDIFVSDEIADNTDLVDFDSVGECFRETFTIYTENAHLFSSRKLYQTSVVPTKDVVIDNN